jgi:L-arabinose isomerase
VSRVVYPKARVGLFGIGLAAYWPQFPGLKDRLEGYLAHVERQLVEAEVVSAGLVDSPSAAYRAGEELAAKNPDLLICYTATYATSSQVLPIVQQARVPVLVLNLQPVSALDYENTDTAEWLANCATCCVPEISNAFARAGIDFRVVSGQLFNDDRAWNKIRDWCRAAAVARAFRGARFGFLGHTYPGMLDMYSDFTAHHAQLGMHVEVLEMGDLSERVNAVSAAQVAAKREEAMAIFDVDASVADEELEWACRVAAGLAVMAADFELDALAYYHRGGENDHERLGAGMILGNSLLTARGLPASGEGDLKNAVAMKALDVLGAGGSYTEFYAMDFDEDFVLMGHDGPGHLAISDRRPVLRGLGLYHGKAGYGVSVEFKVRNGPVTIFGCTQTRDGRLKFLAAEGESLPGPILRIGNTNSRIRFSQSPADFVDTWCSHGPTHHCALGVGHVAGTLGKFAELKGIEFAQV